MVREVGKIDPSEPRTKLERQGVGYFSVIPKILRSASNRQTERIRGPKCLGEKFWVLVTWKTTDVTITEVKRESCASRGNCQKRTFYANLHEGKNQSNQGKVTPQGKINHGEYSRGREKKVGGKKQETNPVLIMGNKQYEWLLGCFHVIWMERQSKLPLPGFHSLANATSTVFQVTLFLAIFRRLRWD